MISKSSPTLQYPEQFRIENILTNSEYFNTAIYKIKII